MYFLSTVSVLLYFEATKGRSSGQILKTFRIQILISCFEDNFQLIYKANNILHNINPHYKSVQKSLS